VTIAGPVRPEFVPVMETLKKVESPIASIDVPSGRKHNVTTPFIYKDNLTTYLPVFSFVCVYYGA